MTALQIIVFLINLIEPVPKEYQNKTDVNNDDGKYSSNDKESEAFT